ncbi:fibronectin type III-like domain-contianing protein [Microbacterium sp. AGC85]
MTDLDVEPTGPDTATATVTVRNASAIAGKYVVQIYVETTASTVRRPGRELREFAKVDLAPGEARTVSFALDRRAFAYWGVRYKRWVVPSGEYRVQVGANARDVLIERTLKLEGEELVPVIELGSTVGDWLSHPAIGGEVQARLLGKWRGRAACSRTRNSFGCCKICRCDSFSASHAESSLSRS